MWPRRRRSGRRDEVNRPLRDIPSLAPRPAPPPKNRIIKVVLAIIQFAFRLGRLNTWEQLLDVLGEVSMREHMGIVSYSNVLLVVDVVAILHDLGRSRLELHCRC